MKKSLLIGLLGVGTAVAAYGQGQIIFSNYYSSHQATGITYGNGPNVGLGVGPEISVELMYGPTTDTAISQLTLLASSISPVGVNSIVGPGPLTTAYGSYAGTGVFSAGNVTLGAYGSTYKLALFAFSSGDVYTGYSSMFTGANQASLFVGAPPLPVGLQEQSFVVLAVIPEPTTMALGVLGGLSLLMLRRKQS
jgi:hypothetical protein